MNSSKTDIETLIALARRGKLSTEQITELQRRMKDDPNAMDLLRCGRAFDQVDTVQPGDESFVARVVEKALRDRRRRRSRSRVKRLGAWPVAALVIALSASALGVAGLRRARLPSSHATWTAPGGASGLLQQLSSARSERGSPATVGTASWPSLSAVTPDMPASGTLSTASPPAPPSSESMAKTRSPSRPDPSDQPSTPFPASSVVPIAKFEAETEPATPTDLFRLASEARRQGATAVCIRRYRELQQQFPGSPEARQSHVSLGKVLQAKGDTEAALREFTRYLEQPGALEEEALVGRAEALKRLARGAEERATWQRLLAQFPASLYAVRARERLVELGGQ